MHLYVEKLLCDIGFAIVYYIENNEGEISISGMERFRSKTVYYVRVQDILLCMHTRSIVYTQTNLLCIQGISCACTTLLCMLWARDPRGQGPKKGVVQGPGPAQRPENW